MPGARIKVAQFLVFHLVKFGVELNKLVILISMKRGYVVTGPKSQGPPDKRQFMPRKQIARITDMGDVFQLESNMVHSHLVTSDEIDRMVIWVAAHEDKKIFDPV